MDLNASDKFEIICRHKDSNPSNLNKVFESYGCNTLEAKVPVVSDKIVEKLKNAPTEQQNYGTLELKSKSALDAIDGRPSRTRNRQLTVVGIGKETIISAGKERERSPVDREELDFELEEYMRVTSKLKAAKIEREKERNKPNEPLFTIPKIINENLSLDHILNNMKSG